MAPAVPKYVRAVCRRPGRRHGQPQQHRSDWPRPLTTLADMRCAPSSTQSPAAATGKSVPAQRGMHTRSSGSKSDCRHAEQQPLVPPAAASRAIAAAWRPLGLRSTMPQQQQPRESNAGDSLTSLSSSSLPAAAHCHRVSTAQLCDPSSCESLSPRLPTALQWLRGGFCVALLSLSSLTPGRCTLSIAREQAHRLARPRTRAQPRSGASARARAWV